MSKIDKIKEEIGWLKVTFILLVATDVSLVGWVAQNFDQAADLLFFLATLAIIAITLAIVSVNYHAYKRISELGGYNGNINGSA